MADGCLPQALCSPSPARPTRENREELGHVLHDKRFIASIRSIDSCIPPVCSRGMTSIGRTQLETALRALGDLLEARGLHYEVVLIGGGNLILRGLVARPTTKDLDLLGEWTADGVKPMRPMPAPHRGR